MKVPSLIVDYSRLSDAQLDTIAQGVITALNGNPAFPTTNPPIDQFATTKNNFSISLSKSLGGDRTAIAVKNQCRADLLVAMRLLANDIEALCAGDRAKLVSSGFELTSDGDSVPPLAAPADFKITDGPSKGELKFSCKKVPQAVSYIFEYTENEVTENSKWTSKSSTSKECVFSGLRSGARIYGRVTAVGRKDQETVSEIASRLVQ